MYFFVVGTELFKHSVNSTSSGFQESSPLWVGIAVE